MPLRSRLCRHILKKVQPEALGQGILQSLDVLGVRPVVGLPQTKADNDSSLFLRVITGLGAAEA